METCSERVKSVFREGKEGEGGKSENGVWDVSGGNSRGGGEGKGGGGVNLNSIVLFPHWAVLGRDMLA